jgi:uncharacterized protein with PhoU and TrkA domain
MRQLLQPGGLTYRIEAGAVVLTRDPNPPRGTGALVSYAGAGKTVQDIALELAAQVGLGYDFAKSVGETAPECQKFVDHVAIEQQPFDVAITQILSPVGLRYFVENGKVVLYRK